MEFIWIIIGMIIACSAAVVLAIKLIVENIGIIFLILLGIFVFFVFIDWIS